eukprot:CCRYP_015026-RI/>CCRYP_015026-RI protein AED:0.48 eAED:1.00 QI:0/0/0/1/0/0/2/0/69
MTTLKVSLGILLTKEFAGLTTSEVPATISKSVVGKSWAALSKNSVGNDDPNNTVLGLTDKWPSNLEVWK